MSYVDPAFMAIPKIGQKQLLLVARERLAHVSSYFSRSSPVNASWLLLGQRDVEDDFRSVERRLRGAGRRVGAVLLLDAQLFPYEVEEIKRLAKEARLPISCAGDGSRNRLSAAVAALRALTLRPRRLDERRGQFRRRLGAWL